MKKSLFITSMIAVTIIQTSNDSTNNEPKRSEQQNPQPKSNIGILFWNHGGPLYDDRELNRLTLQYFQGLRSREEEAKRKQSQDQKSNTEKK